MVNPNIAAETPLETAVEGNSDSLTTNVAKRRGRPPGATNKAKTVTSPLEDKVPANELRTRLTHVLNTIAMLVRSDARFSEQDMDNVSKGIVDVINLFPAARVIVRVLGPISVVGDIGSKVREIMDGRKAKETNNGKQQPATSGNRSVI